MNELLERAVEILDEEGVGQLMGRTKQWLRYRYGLFACRNLYSCAAGESRRVELSGTTIELFNETINECVMIEESYRTEVPVVEKFVELLRPEDVFWDVGSNLGFYSCLAAVAGHDVDICAFDPHPKNAQRTRENVALNGSRADVFQFALHDSVGYATFDPGDASTPGHGGAHVVAGRELNSESFEVPTRTGNLLVVEGQVERPTVVKIDVEGAEQSVLEGMDAVLDDCRALLVEVHRTRIEEFGGASERVEKILLSHGFALEKIHDRGGEGTYHLLGRKRT